ncbi:MAG: hypothetical protein KJ072_27620 [Verrucomicrobia bacterium]|nr:hypothetical protein [Verrucomicrobiota bacterium]
MRLNGEPAAGRYFVQWSGAVGTGALSPVELTITNPNPAVSALFGTLPANHYALTVRVEGGPGNTVTRAPEQPYYASGTPVTLTAAPTPGERFWGWLGDVVSTQEQAMVTMTANRTVIAQFGAVPPVPANDAFANRILLTGPEVLTTGRNAWATKEPGEPNHGGPGGNSIWWEWTSPASGPAVVSTLGSDFDTILGVYTGSALNALSLVGADDDGNGDLTSKVTFNALAGTRYLIAVDGGGMPAAEGHVRLTVVVNTPPVVSLTAPITGTLLSLPGEVPLAADASDPGGAVARVDFLVNGSVLVTDTSAPYAYTWVNPPAGVHSIQARAVDDWGASTTSNPVTLTVRVPNDLFADRLILTGTSSSRIGTTAGATVEPGEPTPTTQTPARHSVWYAWTAPNDGGAVLEVNGHGFEPVAAVYTFAPGESEFTVNRLDQLANASGNPIATLSFFITAGKTYYLAVDGRAGGSGSFDLTLASSQLPSVNIVSPTTGTAFVAPATVGVTVNAIDLDGTISRVEVLFNGLSGGVSTSKPYGVTTSLTIQQAYTLTAVATDNLGFSSTSAPVVVVVRGPVNQSPTVAWQQPSPGAEFGPGDPIPMHADATDPDGLVARVEFYSGSTWLATISEAPYQSVWRGAAQGPHTLRAVAVDLEGARATNNLPINVVVPVPENDAFADRAVLSGARTTGLGNNLGASWEPGEPAHAGLLPARSLWWTWTAPGAGRLSLNTVGSGFDTVLAVYAGSNLAELTALAANHDDGTNLTSRLSLPVTGGQTVGIAVDSASDSGGAVVLNLEFDQAPVVTLTSPSQGAAYVAPADVPLAALASDAENPIARVDFLQDGLLTRSVNQAPFESTLSGLGNGTYLIQAVAVDGAGLSVTSAPATVVVSAASLNQAVFRIASATYSVSENAGHLVARIEKRANSPAASVNYATVDGTARALSGAVGDYQATSGRLDFSADDLFKLLSISVVDDLAYEGDQTFSLVLANPTAGGVLGSPSATIITIVDNDLPAQTTSLTEVAYPAPAPAADNGLRVVLEPASAGGQWRLRWETAWRPSGSALLGLVAGNYDLEFRPVPDFLQPGNLVVPVSGGSLVTVTNVYDRTLTPAVGSLRVILEPSALATAANEVERAQWRLRGESFWRNSAEVIATLPVGEHVIEFKSVNGYETPRPRVASVVPNQLTEWAVTYWLASVSPGTGPSVIPDHGSIMGELLSGYPYAYAGQLLTDAGYGTGFVVKRRVVLTAAHVVFNDASLSFVKRSWWFFQRHRDDFDPIPQTPRGWYVFEGYAAQRARDASPGVSSPASQHLDAAALYFLEDAGRGGYGGYLVSESEPNSWLLGPVQKLLVGYPVEGVPETDRGRMHRVAPMNYSFEPIGDQVYRTTGLKSYAGNSGGPLCVLYPNGRYYPAAIYLGGSGQSVVRAIDPDVVDLINRAEVTASTGDNQVGGGAESFGPRDDQTGFAPGRLQVELGPATALADGAGWRLAGLGPADYVREASAVYSLVPADYTLEFKPVDGWRTPPNLPITLRGGETRMLQVQYLPPAPTQPSLTAARLTSQGQQFRFEITGQPGVAYALDFKTNLSQPLWTPVVTNLAGTSGRWLFIDFDAAWAPARYYRVRALP